MSPVWKASIPPDLHEILDSAVEDTREGRHEQALAKFLWFHENALQYEQGFSGVRLSFALAYWLELASVYPAAHDAFLDLRDKTEKAFLGDPNSFKLFHDVSALNKQLGDGNRTARLFINLAERDQIAAQRLYHVAEDDLIAAGYFQECGPFLDPQKRLEIAADCYHMLKQHEESSLDQEFETPKLSRKNYIENISTLVALLVLNNRAEDAKVACETALQTIDDADFRLILDAAMTGHFPKDHEVD